jgi:Fic family protein
MKIRDFIFENRDYFEDYITRSTYHSNGIEGNTLSYAETYAILWNDNSFTVNTQPRELYEAINHKYALNYVLNNLDQDLSESMIKHIAITINKNINEIDGYRKGPVFIRGAEHIPPAPDQLPQLMMYYVYNYNHTAYDGIFEKIAATHLEFERIHPFSDGNGRTGRLLINYELLRHDIPPVVIPKDERTSYFDMLSSNDQQSLSRFLKTLSIREYERLKKFGYKKVPLD